MIRQPYRSMIDREMSDHMEAAKQARTAEKH